MSAKVPCPQCGHKESAVYDSRGVRRRRACNACGNRFTTYEVTAEQFHTIEAKQTAIDNALRVLSAKLVKPPSPIRGLAASRVKG